MTKTNIDTYIRLKPPIGLTEDDLISYKITHNHGNSSNNDYLEVFIPEDNKKYHYINNNPRNYLFKVRNVYDILDDQDDVYNKIGPSLIKNALEGYNNTVFCYGQTGSGKTYTMSGSKSWKERGLIPRFIIDLFKNIKNQKDFAYEAYVSYLEIYNENAYDLLDTSTSELEKWKKIIVYEDYSSNIVLKNLNTVKVTNEKEALDIFMTGNFNRQVGSSSLNMVSSRSHAIFTLSIEGKGVAVEKMITSKINLVDLAGSERINKKEGFTDTHVNSHSQTTISEAKYINLSLSFLEQVIIALNEKNLSNRFHIPYRNSLMTTILKDSLGGNCKTILIANISVDCINLDETLSTLRFAVRCSKVENEVKVNESLDLNTVIAKLNHENEELRRQLNNQKTQKINEIDVNDVVDYRNLGLREKDECKILINEYINNRTKGINTKDLSKLYFIIDYLIDYINNKEKIYNEKISLMTSGSYMSNSNLYKSSSNLINIGSIEKHEEGREVIDYIEEYKKLKQMNIEKEKMIKESFNEKEKEIKKVIRMSLN